MKKVGIFLSACLLVACSEAFVPDGGGQGGNSKFLPLFVSDYEELLDSRLADDGRNAVRNPLLGTLEACRTLKRIEFPPGLGSGAGGN